MTYECWSLEAIPDCDEELFAGYQDGRKGEPEPGANRHPAYIHGWWTGSCDAGHRTSQPWMKELARQYVAKSRAALAVEGTKRAGE